MAGLRGIRDLTRSVDSVERGLPARAEKRQAVRSTVISAATLACRHCDAPIAPGPDPLSLTDRIWCPMCHESGPVRDFLSLAAPARPAHVVVRIA